MDYPIRLINALGEDADGFRSMMAAIWRIGETRRGICTYNQDAIMGGDLRLKYARPDVPGLESDTGDRVKAAFCNVKNVMEELSDIHEVRYPALEREGKKDAQGNVRVVSSTVKIDIDTLRAYIHAYKKNPERFLKAFSFEIEPEEVPSPTLLPEEARRASSMDSDSKGNARV